jgi:fibrillarin-like rRNA methylase
MFSPEFIQALDNAQRDIRDEHLTKVLRVLWHEIAQLERSVIIRQNGIALKTADGSIVVKGNNIAVESSGRTVIKASGNLELKAAKVLAN